MEAEAVLRFRRKGAPIGEGLFQEHKSPDDVGVDEIRSLVDRSVDMAFGRQMDDRVGSHVADQAANVVAVGDVATNEAKAPIAGDRFERVEIAGIGQLVEDRDLVRRGCNQVADQRRADEAGAAGDQITSRCRAGHFRPLFRACVILKGRGEIAEQ